MRFLLLALLTLMAIRPTSGAAPAPIGFDRVDIRSWGSNAGLPEESIFALEETPDGSIWLATRDGLFRFDGQRFHAVGLGRNNLSRDSGTGAVVSDGKRLIVGGRDFLAIASPDRYESFLNSRFGVFPFARKDTDRFGISDLHFDSSGKLWIRRGDGVYSLTPEQLNTGNIHPSLELRSKPDELIRAFQKGPDGTYYVATNLRNYAVRNQQWETISTIGNEPPATSMLLDDSGALWVLTLEGLKLWNGTTKREYPMRGRLSVEPVRALSRDRNGGLWVGLIDGVARLENGRAEFLDLSRYLRSGDMILSVLHARDGTIWCGSKWGALVRIQTPVFEVIDQRQHLADSAAASVAEDGTGRMWLGTRVQGAYVYANGGWRAVPNTIGGVLYSLVPWGKDKMLVADSRGLWMSDGSRTWPLIELNETISQGRYRALSAPIGSTIYYSDSRQVFRLRFEQEKLVEQTPIAQSPLVRSILAEKEGVWMASWEEGLVLSAGGRVEKYRYPGKGELRAMTLFALNERYLMLGTSMGLYAFDRQSRQYLDLAIAPDENIFHLLRDQSDRIWLLGRRSLRVIAGADLVKYVTGQTKSLSPVIFTTQQGLASVNFGLGTSHPAFQRSDGEVWMASVAGFIHFQPGYALSADDSVRCAIEALYVDGARESIEGSLQLAPGTRRVQINFSPLDRKINQNPIFRFWMQGYDPSPVETQGQLQAEYTNLPPGKYVFFVQARGASQAWTSPAAELEFEILPYWYEKRSVQAFLGMLLLTLITLLGLAASRRARSKREELEQRVQSRTAELAAARDEAQQAARVKADFLATMSHEIRTPMNGVIGMIQLMECTDLTDEQKHMLQIMRNSGETLVGIVNDVLDLSKIEAGRLELESVPIQLRDWTGFLRQLFEAQAQEKSLELQLSLQEDLPEFFLGDPIRLRQILINLLGNALKFTEKGSIQLSVGLADDLLHFQVLDTGIGIPADKIHTIFDEFTQAESSTTRRFGGTGLGLTISQKLARAMGGRIVVQSEPGKGSSFSLEIPFRPCPTRLLPHPETNRPGNQAIPALRVLLVEDNPVNRLVAQSMLEKLGCIVTLAHDGHQAVALAASNHFDLILMDCHMPVMDGYEATRQIRQMQDGTAQTPIFALTAGALEEDRHRSNVAGMDGHISKPLDLNDLRLLLAKLAKNSPAD